MTETPAQPAESVVERDRRLAEYIVMLEDAVNMLWGWMPAEQVKEIRDDTPLLADFCGHVHHKVSHEEAMVRRNVWAEGEAGTDG